MGSIHPTDFIIYDFNKKMLLLKRFFSALVVLEVFPRLAQGI